MIAHGFRLWRRLRRVFDPVAGPGPEQMFVRLAMQLELERPAGERAKSILLTSPTSEGLIRDAALELAYTVAEEMGRRVLLVDADFGRRTAAPQSPGLTDVLVQGATGLLATVRATDHELVFALPLGSPELAAASLAAGRHAELVKQACRAYQSVIFMGGPVLHDPKWLMLAPLVDHSLLLAAEGRTPVSDLDASLRVLAECKAGGVGVVLTRTREQRPPKPVGAQGDAPALIDEPLRTRVAEPLRSRTDP